MSGASRTVVSHAVLVEPTSRRQRGVVVKYDNGEVEVLGAPTVVSIDGTPIEEPEEVSTRLAWGAFHPRIARPFVQTDTFFWPGYGTAELPPMIALDRAGWRAADTAEVHVFEQLAAVCRVVEPIPANSSACGQELRNILIASATRVEAAWKSILRENGYAQATNWNRVDYSKLASTLRLPEWSVALEMYPDWGPIEPFRDWPTSLPWYDDYNAVKHDGDAALPRATLRSVITAAAATFVMRAVQFGSEIRPLYTTPSLARFAVLREPSWPLEDHYAGPRGEWQRWTTAPHPAFDGATR